jgi:dihydropyrimidine dehydrogenase (NAD+) subunit PreA
VKPIALNMVASVASNPKVGIPISGIGGIANWKDAVEFMLLGSTSVQVCTAAMHYGFRIVEDMISGLDGYLASKGMNSAMDLVGKSVNKVRDWGNLDLNYKVVAKIDAEKCIGCNLCYIACEDGAHQCITAAPRPVGDLRDGHTHKHMPHVIEEECVGCNLCALVCPVPDCITMQQMDTGRTSMNWRQLQEARGKNPQCSMEDLLAKG